MTSTLTLTLSDAVMWTTLFTVAVTIVKCVLVDPIRNELVKLGLAIDRLNEESKNRIERLIKVEEKAKQVQDRLETMEERCLATCLNGFKLNKGTE